MKLHSPIVLKISSILINNQLIYKYLKLLYFKLNYFLFADKNFKYKIINGYNEKLCLDKTKEFFFGYHHTTPWSCDDKYIAIHSIVNKDKVNINIINTSDSKTVFSDSTSLWNFQQGSMLGWVPSKHIIYYNKLIDGMHKTVLYNLSKKESSYHKFPIQAMHPKEDFYLSINYSHLDSVNNDYGYRHKCKVMSKYDYGIWKCYLDNSDPDLLISKKHIKKINKDYNNSFKHEINHCLFSDNGENFLFIYRYLNNKIKYSKLILANHKNNDIRILNNKFVSHMSWINNQKIFYFGDSVDQGRGYYIFNIRTGKSKRVMDDNLSDGHPSVSPDKEWVIIDTYPDRFHNCLLYLYNINDEYIVDIGMFKSNINFHGYNRCDLHPRWDNRGNKIMIDSSHKGKRYPLVIDLQKVLNV